MQICTTKSAILNTLALEARFPLTVVGCRDGGSICHLQIQKETMLRGVLGVIADSGLCLCCLGQAKHRPCGAKERTKSDRNETL